MGFLYEKIDDSEACLPSSVNRFVHVKWVNCMVCELYINKVV